MDKSKNISLISLSIDKIDTTGFSQDNPVTLEILYDSIKKYGMLLPISISSNTGKFKLIDGWKRLEVCKILGQEFIDAIIVDNLEDAKVLEAQIQLKSSNWNKYLRITYFFEQYHIGQGARTDKGKNLSYEFKDHQWTKTRKTTRKIVSEKTGLSESEVHRIKVVGDMHPHFLKMLDENQIGSLNKCYQFCTSQKKIINPIKNFYSQKKFIKYCQQWCKNEFFKEDFIQCLQHLSKLKNVDEITSSLYRSLEELLKEEIDKSSNYIDDIVVNIKEQIIKGDYTICTKEKKQGKIIILDCLDKQKLSNQDELIIKDMKDNELYCIAIKSFAALFSKQSQQCIWNLLPGENYGYLIPKTEYQLDLSKFSYYDLASKVENIKSKYYTNKFKQEIYEYHFDKLYTQQKKHHLYDYIMNNKNQ